jgi:hypothetical protein
LPEDADLAKVLKSISQMGLTDGVLSVLKASDEPLSTIQVRDQLIRLGFDVGRFKNALSAINTVLTRLPKEQVETSQDEQTGKALYRWKPPSRDPWDKLVTLPAKNIRDVFAKAAKSMVGYEDKKAKAAKRSPKQ